MDPERILSLILMAPGAILAISLHEAMHGYVADRLGDSTARSMGRLTLNPFKHIDPVGTVLVPAILYLTSGLMFGWARPVPVNIFNLRNPKRDMAVVAAAGPGANLVLALSASICLFLLSGLLSVTNFNVGTIKAIFFPLAMILQIMVYFNLFLMMFNLIPIPPLDGGRILVGLLPRKQAEAVAAIEPFGFFILVALMVIGRSVFNYLFYPVSILADWLVPNSLSSLIGG